VREGRRATAGLPSDQQAPRPRTYVPKAGLLASRFTASRPVFPAPKHQ